MSIRFGTDYANSMSSINYTLSVSTSSPLVQLGIIREAVEEVTIHKPIVIIEEKIMEQEKDTVQGQYHEELSIDSESRDFNRTDMELDTKEDVSKNEKQNNDASTQENPQQSDTSPEEHHVTQSLEDQSKKDAPTPGDKVLKAVPNAAKLLPLATSVVALTPQLNFSSNTTLSQEESK